MYEIKELEWREQGFKGYSYWCERSNSDYVIRQPACVPTNELAVCELFFENKTVGVFLDIEEAKAAANRLNCERLKVHLRLVTT